MSGLLKFITCGSVDDGKSTLIGHILYDSKLLYADQEKALLLDSKGIESDAETLDEIIDETLSSVESERTTRVIDSDGGAASMEKRKREGYF